MAGRRLNPSTAASAVGAAAGLASVGSSADCESEGRPSAEIDDERVRLIFRAEKVIETALPCLTSGQPSTLSTSTSPAASSAGGISSDWQAVTFRNIGNRLMESGKYSQETAQQSWLKAKEIFRTAEVQDAIRRGVSGKGGSLQLATTGSFHEIPKPSSVDANDPERMKDELERLKAENRALAEELKRLSDRVEDTKVDNEERSQKEGDFDPYEFLPLVSFFVSVLVLLVTTFVFKSPIKIPKFF